MPDYCMCRDTLCPNRHDCFRYRAVPNGWRQSYFAGTPQNDIAHCEHFMDIKGWPDEMLRPEGEEVELTEPEEQAIMARAAAIEAAGQRAMAHLGMESLDDAADAARERAKVLLAKRSPHPVLVKFLAPFVLARDAIYSAIWVMAFIVVAPFVLLWRLARRLGPGE